MTDSEIDPIPLNSTDGATEGGRTDAESSSPPGTSVPTESAVSENLTSAHRNRRLIAAALSALFPGAGQLFLGQRVKGSVLLVLFALVVLCFWPLRVPIWWEGFMSVFAIWIGLSWYSVGAALLARESPDGRRPSWRWVLLVPLLSWIGVNLVWTPLFWVAGFRTREFLGSSMQPTLFDHDYLIVDTHYYRKAAVERRELVEFRRNGSLLMKRVIAIGGDTIEGKDGRIQLNGQVLDEPFIKHTDGKGEIPSLGRFGPLSVPKGKYFVMGDNPEISLDSRSFGLVDDDAISGKPLYVYRTRGKGWMMRRNIE